MPAALTYPGVYIQEVPSGVRTITGRRDVDHRVRRPRRRRARPTNRRCCTSFADYERQFGGLEVACPMSYAVRDFYLNGGTLALIVRVVHDDAATATITLAGDGSPADDLVLEASSAGELGQPPVGRGRPRHRPRAAARLAAGDQPAALQPHGALPRAGRQGQLRGGNLRLGVHRRRRSALPAAGARARIGVRAHERHDAGRRARRPTSRRLGLAARRRRGSTPTPARAPTAARSTTTT